MRVGIYGNIHRDRDEQVLEKVKTVLESQSIEYVVWQNISDIDNKIDALIVLGGDGTILKAANRCAEMDVAILAVNLGNLGFLSEIEISEIEKCLIQLKNGDWKIESRTMLVANYKNQEYVALNDVAVVRDNSVTRFSKVIQVTAKIDDVVLAKYVGDGVIVSTPTGSTAYSLSAGGAVLSPTVSATIITSICPHSLHSKPIVIADDEVVTLSPKSVDKASAMLVCDGVNCATITSDVVIKKYHKKAKFIKLKNISFYTKLLNKLSKLS